MTVVKARPNISDWFIEQNPKLKLAEIGLELDTGKFKIGDGLTYWEDLSYVGGNGGSQPGAVVTRKFDFAFDDAGLADGIEFWTPDVGTRVIDAWVEITAAWDGTTPKCDFGPQDDEAGSPGLLTYATSNGQVEMDSAAWYDGTNAAAFLVPGSGHADLLQSNFSTVGVPASPALPLRVTAAKPWSVWVSQDGFPGGDDPEAAQGQATLVVMYAEPAYIT